VGTGKMTDDGKLIPLQVQKGQKVLYGKYSGTEIKENGKDYLIVRESDILAILS
jgi:chaperonin GroES